MEHIPIVDLSKISGPGTISDKDLTSTAEELFKALSGIGFAYLSNHGIPQETIDKAFEESKKFFELPSEMKEKSLSNIKERYNSGYVKPGQELLKETSRYEIRESYDVSLMYHAYPESHPPFQPALAALEAALKPLVKNILRILAVCMNLEDKDFFVKGTKNFDDPEVSSLNCLRSLYYPVIPDHIPAGTVRLAEHTDYGTVTVLLQDSIGGLQVKSVTGKWVDAVPIPGKLLLNTGDLLEFWSGGKFPATWHRVLIPEEETKKKTHRQSIAFFVHPDGPVCVTPLIGDSSQFKTITAAEYAKKRLDDTYAY